MSQPRSNVEVLVEASIILARIQHARGNTSQAQETLRALVTRIRLPRLLRQIQMWQARYALQTNGLDEVQRWYAALTKDESPRLHQEQEALLAARMFIADGKPETALEIIEPWYVDTQGNGRTRSEIETLCIKALAQSAQSNREQAKKTITRALKIAQPKNYRRIFLDEGEAMRSLISNSKFQIEKSRALSDYVAKLLTAFSNPKSEI